MRFNCIPNLNSLGKTHGSGTCNGVAKDVFIVHELIKIAILHLASV